MVSTPYILNFSGNRLNQVPVRVTAINTAELPLCSSTEYDFPALKHFNLSGLQLEWHVVCFFSTRKQRSACTMYGTVGADRNGGSRPEPNGAAHASIYPYGPFQTGSGESVLLGIQNEQEWRSFCTIVLRQPELSEAPQFSSNSLRLANKEELSAVIHKTSADLSAEEVIARLDKAPIANGKMNTLREVWDHPQLNARGRWMKVETPTATIETLLSPGVMSESDIRMEPITAVGAHTEAIIEELRLEGLELSQVSKETSEDAVISTRGSA